MRIATKTEENMQSFMDEWVFQCPDQYALMDKLSATLGGARYMDNLRRLQKAEEFTIEDKGVDFSYNQVVPKWD